MTDPTPLDTAHAAMEAAPGDDAARLRFYERLADCELFLLLTEEAQGDNLSPEVFDLADESFVLVFDREDRLARFVGKPAPYAALSGRVVTALLSDQGIGMGVNLDVAPSSILIPPQAVTWLAGTLRNAPDEAEALTFSGIEAGALDVAFFRAAEPMAARLAQHGLRFDLPQPAEAVQEVMRMAPGSDPSKPPILR